MHLISNGINGVNINSLLQIVALLQIFSKSTQPIGFVKPNIIRISNYKVKYIRQVAGGLIIFFRNSRIIFFKTSWLNCEQ